MGGDYCRGRLPGWVIRNARVGWASPGAPAPLLGRSAPFLVPRRCEERSRLLPRPPEARAGLWLPLRPMGPRGGVGSGGAVTSHHWTLVVGGGSCADVGVRSRGRVRGGLVAAVDGRLGDVAISMVPMTVPMSRVPVATVAVPRFGAFALLILGSLREATEELRAPVVALALAAATAVLVIVAASVGGVPGWLVVAVTR